MEQKFNHFQNNKKQENDIFKDIDDEENSSSEESDLDDEQKDIFFNSSNSNKKIKEKEKTLNLNEVEEENVKEKENKEDKVRITTDFGEIDISKQGTLVQLDNVQEFNIGAGQVTETLGTISKDLHFHIGLHFHRFIESKKINIFVKWK